MCKYCEINPKTKLGRDYYRDDHVEKVNAYIVITD